MCARDVFATTMVRAASGTSFLPSGHEGQIVMQKKHSDASVVRIFETSSADHASWSKFPERPVISVDAAPENVYAGFSPADSSVIRFAVPVLKRGLWEERTFVVRICDRGPAGDAWAIVTVPLSSPIWAKCISAVVLLLFYLGLTWGMFRIRRRLHPLAAKYPSFARTMKHGWLSYLDPVVLTANAFNKGSIQKLQVLLFSFLVSGMVLSLVLTRGVLSDLSVTVALLLGISAVGAAVGQKG
jgi:hypothetical protein